MNMPKWIFGSDIDGTQTEWKYNPAFDAASHRLKSVLADLREDGSLFHSHNTGRSYPLQCFEPLPGCTIDRYMNPIIVEGDAVIHTAGTAIRYAGADRDCPIWHAKIGAFTPPRVVEELRRELSQVEGIRPSGEIEVTPYKSAYLLQNLKEHRKIEAAIQTVIDRRFAGQFEAVWNSPTIDVIPRGVNKRSALEHVVEHVIQLNRTGHGTPVESPKVIVAGDGFNDLPALMNRNWHAIVVGNANDAVKDAVRQNNPNAFIASPDRPSALGVLDGLEHFGVIKPVSQPVIHMEPGRVERSRSGSIWESHP